MKTLFVVPVVCFATIIIKQINLMLLCVFSVINHRRHTCKKVVGTSVTDLAIALVATYLFLPHVIYY